MQIWNMHNYIKIPTINPEMSEYFFAGFSDGGAFIDESIEVEIKFSLWLMGVVI